MEVNRTDYNTLGKRSLSLVMIALMAIKCQVFLNFLDAEFN